MTKRPTIRVHGRSVLEWIGKTPDSMPPPTVRARIFDAHDGRCHISDEKIKPGDAWDLEHKKSLRNGGENRETNLAPALRSKHREKTAQENKDGAKADRMHMAHIGVRKEPTMKSRKRDKAPAQHRASKIEPGSKVAQIRALREAQHG